MLPLRGGEGGEGGGSVCLGGSGALHLLIASHEHCAGMQSDGSGTAVVYKTTSTRKWKTHRAQLAELNLWGTFPQVADFRVAFGAEDVLKRPTNVPRHIRAVDVFFAA